MVQDSPSNQPFGAQVIQTHSLSTPVTVLLLLMALCTGASVVYAWAANDKAWTAEREARLAQNRSDTLEVDVKVMRGLLEARGIKMPEEAKR